MRDEREIEREIERDREKRERESHHAAAQASRGLGIPALQCR